MPEAIAPKAYQCRHLFTDGHRCGSRSLRGEEFCFYHHQTRKPLPRPTPAPPAEAAFDLPFPEDRPAIQLAIGEVLQRIARNQIDPRRAGLLLYGLQIASLNLPKPSVATEEEPAAPVEDIVDHPTHGPIAPIAEARDTERPLSFAARFLREIGEEIDPPQPGPASILPILQATAGTPSLPIRYHAICTPSVALRQSRPPAPPPSARILPSTLATPSLLPEIHASLPPSRLHRAWTHRALLPRSSRAAAPSPPRRRLPLDRRRLHPLPPHLS